MSLLRVIKSQQTSKIITFLKTSASISRIRELSTSITFKPTKAANRAAPLRLPPTRQTTYQNQLLPSMLPSGLNSPSTSRRQIRTLALTTLTETSTTAKSEAKIVST
ncbi:hypothetical protein NPIL_470121 [Nephila pilipes]|uniref:Uncharacterized protein n=1 Tax=Nephila pilipes TaxID=299642 RepID=A0A8X6NGV9_NEPPI|nr:hypothetical protein NPIL_470121 [Nephila pilipes]